MVRPRHRDHVGRELANGRLPEKRIPLLCSPFSRRLPALDLEMLMRPAARTAFLSQEADPLPFLDGRTQLDGWLDRLHVTVPVIPATIVAEVDDVVSRPNRCAGGIVLRQ